MRNNFCIKNAQTRGKTNLLLYVRMCEIEEKHKGIHSFTEFYKYKVKYTVYYYLFFSFSVSLQWFPGTIAGRMEYAVNVLIH